MAFTTAWDQAQATDSRYPYRVGVQILTDATDTGSWCDINKPVPTTAADLFYNRLVKFPTVEVRSEVRPGRFASSVSSIVVDDWDAAFGKQLPWSMWNITGGPESLVSWYHARLRVRIAHHAGNTGTWIWNTIGTFLIEDIQRDAENKTATIKLVGLEKILMDAKASTVRTGDSWMVNAPIPLIARRLVEASGAGALTWETGSPPASCTLATSESYFSPVGNIPTLAGSPPVWNEHNNFVPRFSMVSTTDSSIIYFVGHTITTNKAAAVRWNTTANTWTREEYDLAGYGAAEAIYAVQDATYNTDKLYIVATGNALQPPGDQSPHNHSIVIFEVSAADISYVNANTNAAVYIPQYLASEPCWYVGVLYWGSFAAAVLPYRGQNVPVFFRSQVNAPGYDASGVSVVTVDTASADYPDSMTNTPHNHVCSINVAGSSSCTTFADWECDTGYYHLKRTQDSPDDPWWPARAPVHTQLSEAFRYDATRHCVYWIQWHENSTHTVGNWYLSHFSIDTELYGMGQIINHGGGHYGLVTDFLNRCVTAFDVVATSASAGYLWLAVEAHPSGAGDYVDTAARTKLYRFSLPAHNTTLSSPTDLTFPDLYWSAEWVTRDQRWWAPLIVTIRHNPVNSTGAFNPIWGITANRRGALAQAYSIWGYSTGGALAGGKVNLSGWPVSPCPFVQTAVVRVSGSTLGAEYFQDQATGALYYVGVLNNSTSFLLGSVRYGEACDAENVWASCNLLDWDGPGTAAAIFGVSASNTPADMRCPLRTEAHWGGETADIGARSPGGRITLWQYRSELSDVIRVADFGDDTAWDALDSLRQAAGNYVTGFNAEGAITFRPRSTATPAYTIVKKGDNFAATDMATLGAESIACSLDHSAIINSISVIPRIGEPGSATHDMILTPDSTGDDAVVTVHYSGSQAQRVMLQCIKAGKPKLYSDAVDSAPLLFSWSRPLSDLSTVLRIQAVVTDTDITVYGLYTDGVGSTRLGEGRIEIGDVVYVGDGGARKITAITPDAGFIELDGSVGGTATHKIGSPVRIIPADRSRMGDSSVGVCTLTADFNVPLAGGSRPKLYVSDSSHIRPGMVLYKDCGYVQVVEVGRDGNLVVRGHILGGVRGIGSGATVTWAAGTNLKGAVWVEWLGRTYPAGDTDASFSLSAPAKVADNSTTFAVGDRIIITCPGMVLRKMNNAVVRHENALSIERYGKKEYRLGDNHLLDQTRAMAVMGDMEDAPTYLTEAHGVPMVSVFSIGTTVNVKNQHLFPDAAGYAVAHEVIGLRWNLDSGLMDLTMRSITVAGRGDAAEAPVAPLDTVTGWARNSLYVRRPPLERTIAMGVAEAKAVAPDATIAIV